MLLFMSILIVLGIIAIAVLTGGALIGVIFGDLIVCGLIITLLVKLVKKIKGKS